MNRTEARAVAKTLLKAGFHSPTICEDIEHDEIYVMAANRCYLPRTVASIEAANEMLRGEGNGKPDGTRYQVRIPNHAHA